MKYWSLFVRGFIKSVQYRSEIVVWFLLDILPTFILIFVWVSIYSQQNTINGYNLSQVLQYYLLVTLINALTASHFEQWRVREIREGKIDFYLTRPLHYLVEVAIRHLSGKAFYMLIAGPIFLLSWLVIGAFVDLGTLTIPITSLMQFSLLIIFSYLIEFLIATIIVLLGFWIEGAEGLEHFKWVIISLFSGSMIPVALMPTWLQSIVTSLPFRYMYDLPVSILQQKAILQFTDLVYVSFFVLLLSAATWVIWRKAQYQYASSGG
jgi:ABC-2 type transport system permease protein